MITNETEHDKNTIKHDKEIPKIYISPEERQKTIDDLRLI